MFMNEKILNEILKETYYYNYYEFMKNRNKNELIKILKLTLKINSNLNKEIIENENIENLKHYDLYNKLRYTNNINIFILKYLIMKNF